MLVALTVVGVSLPLRSQAAQPQPAAAEPSSEDRQSAARSFAEGQAALKDNRFERAAAAYEQANRSIPSPEALRSATRARYLAGERALAATHAHELQSLYPEDTASAELARTLLGELEPSLIAADVRCSAPCVLFVDGRPLPLGKAVAHRLYTDPGIHSIRAVADLEAEPRTAERIVRGEPGGQLALGFDFSGDSDDASTPTQVQALPYVPEARPVDIEAPARGRGLRRLHPAYALTGLGLTAVGIGVLTWSAVDTRRDLDAYGDEPTDDGWKDIQIRQLRTQVLIGVTAVIATSSVLIAAIATDWSRLNDGGRRAHAGGARWARGARSSMRLSASPGGLRGRF